MAITSIKAHRNLMSASCHVLPNTRRRFGQPDFYDLAVLVITQPYEVANAKGASGCRWTTCTAPEDYVAAEASTHVRNDEAVGMNLLDETKALR
jgi:hypothetical protein